MSAPILTAWLHLPHLGHRIGVLSGRSPRNKSTPHRSGPDWQCTG